MTPNEIKLKNLIGHIDELIQEYRFSVSSALREMEKFNISPEQFRIESFNLNVAAFTLGYLNRIKTVAEEDDYKKVENFIRFHKHQLAVKATGEADAIKVAQYATISCLSTIIDLYLDK